MRVRDEAHSVAALTNLLTIDTYARAPSGPIAMERGRWKSAMLFSTHSEGVSITETMALERRVLEL